MNEYSGLISITSLAVSVLSGLYLNSKIEALTQVVTSHGVQIQDIRTQVTDTGKVTKQAIDITSKHVQDIASLNEDVSAVAFHACGPDFMTPSAEMQMSSFNRRSYSARGRGRNLSSPRSTLTPSDLGSHASQIS